MYTFILLFFAHEIFLGSYSPIVSVSVLWFWKNNKTR